MKQKNIALKAIYTLAVLLFIFGCSENKTGTEAVLNGTETTASAKDDLEGAWELVYTSETPYSKVETPLQLKIFKDGFFCLIMKDSSGKWNTASAGTYETNGKEYKEHHLYSSLPDWIGNTDWQEYEIKGDTLYKKLFTKVTNSKGEDITGQFQQQFEEKRVRVKK